MGAATKVGAPLYRNSLKLDALRQGETYYVDSNRGKAVNDSRSGGGQDPAFPLLTLAQAITNCQAGDTIIVQPGHAETLTAVLTISKARLKIIGLGIGTGRPQLTISGAIDGLSLEAADILIEGFYFNENGTGSATSFINIAGAGCTVRRCHFDQGVNDLEAITVADAGDGFTLEDCDFVVTADGPDAAVEIEAAGVNRTLIRNNRFVCSDGTNAYDAAAINSTVANTTMTVTGNTFLGAAVASNAVVAASALGAGIFSNKYSGGALDVDMDGFAGEVTVIAQPAPLVVDDRVWYVDSVDGTAGGDGHSPQTAMNTFALALAAAAAGDTIIIASAHVETLTTAVDINVAGLSIIGSGVGTRRPTITLNGSVDAWSVSAANVLIQNIMFNESTDASATASINIAAINCIVRGCHFDLGANDTECITIAAAGDGAIIEGNKFIVTANGPLRAIEIEETGVDDLTIRNNVFNGGSATNVWDTAAINSGVAHTNCRIEGNTFTYGIAHLVDTSVSTTVSGNRYGVACRPNANSPLDLYAADGASAVGDGTKEDPTTIVDAVTRATAAGDRVLLLPGLYTVSAALALDVAGVTIKPANGPGTVEIANDTDDIETLTVTAVRVVVEDLMFSKGIANTNPNVLISTTVNQLTVRNCQFDLETRANGEGIVLPTGTKLHVVEDCLFTDAANAAPMISHACSSSIFRRNIFDFSATDALAFEQVASPGDGNSFVDNRIVSDAAAGALMSWDGSPGIQIITGNNIFASGGDTNSCGDDADLDKSFHGNWRDGATNGDRTVLDGSVGV